MTRAELRKLLGSESDTVESVVKEEPSTITRTELRKLLGGESSTVESMVEEKPSTMTRAKLRELLGDESKAKKQPSSWLPSDRFLATGAESIPLVDPFGTGLEKPSLMESIAQLPAGADSRIQSRTGAAPSPLQLMPPLPSRTKKMSELEFSKWKEKQLPTTPWKDRSEGERQMASGEVESSLWEDPVFNAMFGAGLGGKMAARTASGLAPIAKAAAREGASWVMWGADDIAKIANKGISETLYRVGRSQIAKKEGLAAKFLDPSSASVIDDVFINALNVVKKTSPKAVSGFLKKEEAVRKEISNQLSKTAEARFNAQINRGSVRREIDIPTSARETYTSILDKYHPIKKIGETLGDKTEAYRSARLFEGWRGIPDTFLGKETFKFDNKEKITGKSFKDILTPVKDQKKEFGNYMMARRAEELHGRGIETGFHPVDTAFMKNKYQSSTFDKAFDDIKEYQDNVLQYLRDSGVVGQKQYSEIKNLNKDYVPFNTVLELLSKKGGGKSFGNLSKGIKGIKSTHLERVDPLEQIVANTYSLINLAERNRVGRLIGDWSKLKDSGKFVSKVPPKTKGTTLKIEEAIRGINPDVKQVLKEAGISDEVVTIFRPDAFTPQKNVIRVWEQGKPALYELHPELYKSVTAMSPREVNLGLKLLEIPARTLRAGAVVFSPEFAVRNPVRDQISAWLFSRSGYKPGLDMLSGFMSALKKDKFYWDFKKYGGEHAALVSLDRTALRKKLDDVMSNKIKLKNVVNPFEGLRILNEALEQGTRRGEFKSAIKKGESLAESAFGAREVTLDFKRQGGDRLVQIMNRITPFFNPQLQGTDKIMRALGNKETRKNTLIKLTLGITLPSVALYEYNKDFEWYQNLSQWERDLFWTFPVGGDWGDDPSFVLKVPKPFDSGLLFGSVPERMLDYIHTNDPYSLNQSLETLFGGVVPPLMPQAIKVPAELTTGDLGYSEFYDRTIAPRGTEKLEAGYRTGQHEPEIIKKLGAATGYSPSKISYGIKGLTGGAGAHVVDALDYLAKETGAVKSAPGPEKTWKEWPFIKGFIAQNPSRSGAPIQKLYDNIEDIGFKYNTGIKNFRVAAEKNDPDKLEEAKAYWNENISRIDAQEQEWNIPESTNVPAQALTLEGVRQLLAKLSGAADLIYQNRDISPKEQRRLRDEIFLEMLNIAKMVNNQIRSFGK